MAYGVFVRQERTGVGVAIRIVRGDIGSLVVITGDQIGRNLTG